MALFDPVPSSDEELPLGQEITRLVDQFAELDCLNAFLISSFTTAMSAHEPQKVEIILGAKCCAESLQIRSSEFKAALGHVRKRYLAEHE